MTATDVIENKHPANWIELPLHAGGRSLIEASAGTGKTWTIAVLYLRLLLEHGLSPKQIVVTTFTDAAAQELRERIRSRVLAAELQARQALASQSVASGAAPALPPDEEWLASRWRESSHAGADVEKITADLNRLMLASAELDLAPIGTLHGLCRKILTDYPFESGSTFDLGEMVSSGSIHAELIDDLWRCLGQSGGDLSPEDAAWWKAGRSSLSQHLLKAMAPGVTVGVVAEAAIAELMQPHNALMLRTWLGDGSQFTRANSALRSRLTELASFIEADDPTASPPQLAAVLADPVEKHLKPHVIAEGLHAEILEFVQQAEPLLDSLAYLAKGRALARYREELRASAQQRLAAAGKLTFDALIERVHRALKPGGSELANRLFEAWPVAMVDEFQDTDALQYAILDRIYRDPEGAHRGRLIMIGDPKQAIYRFRGGDIDAYLEASAGATSTLTLDTNFRSSRQLIAAFNEFYARAGERLSSNGDHKILYDAVKPSGRCDDEPYRVNGEICETPLQFHYWDDEDVPSDAPGRVALALEACANQIVELLSGTHTIGGKPVQPGDIAVLLPTNPQVIALRDLLNQRDVPCVSSAKSSVFGSDCARELRIVLYAAMHPRDQGAVRAALATRLGGKTFDQLRELRDQPEAWQREASAFAYLDSLWQKRGVLAAVQQVTSDARARLFAGSDSERVLTDLRHLGELLQARSDQLTGREQLLTWLGEQCEEEGDEAGDAADDLQLRIESDAKRVRLMTLHASKGLEFPIVLLPLMWANKQNSKDTISVLHDPESHQRVVGFGAEAKQRYQQEGQDERFRLMYVALTRARHACHVYALDPARPSSGRSEKADTDPHRAPLDNMIEQLLKSGESPDTMKRVLWSSGAWPWPKAKYRAVDAGVLAERTALDEPAATPFEFKYSFSALAKGGKPGSLEERAASDEAVLEDVDVAPAEDALDAELPETIFSSEDPVTEVEQPQLQWLAQIAGADFGNALHAIFEHRAIGRPMAEQHALVRRQLLEEGVSLGEIPIDELVPHLADRVQATLDTPLLPERVPALTLGALPATALRAEMEFNFVLGEVSLRRLREVCDFVPGTSMHSLRGLMNGKIDLVFEHGGRFHVLDYKSNRLDNGADPRNYGYVSNYAPAQLEPAMDRAHYRFQALLYTVAIDRYLRQRLPHYQRDMHLGETIYLFVRATGIALDTVPLAGIWAHRFDDALIDAVDAVFATEAREAA